MFVCLWDTTLWTWLIFLIQHFIMMINVTTSFGVLLNELEKWTLICQLKTKKFVFIRTACHMIKMKQIDKMTNTLNFDENTIWFYRYYWVSKNGITVSSKKMLLLDDNNWFYLRVLNKLFYWNPCVMLGIHFKLGNGEFVVCVE